MIPLINHCHLSDTTGGVRTCPAEALRDTVLYLYTLDCLSQPVFSAGGGSGNPKGKAWCGWGDMLCWKHLAQTVPEDPQVDLQRHVQEPVLPGAELCDYRGQSFLLLCKKHSDRTSVKFLTQTSMKGHSGPAWGT
jgi:hypothetical protein